MTDQTCDTCRHWQPIEYGGVCHLDPEQPEPTVGGWSCGSWQARTGKAQARRQAARGAMTAAINDGFDIEAAAGKVIEAALPEVSISTVRDALRCQYRQAALVVEWLKSTDRVKEA